jgi:UDP-glucose 4-epimerase
VAADSSLTNALVVGGAGFIGSHLVERLLSDGVAVDVVDDLSAGSLANLADARSMSGTLKIHHLDATTAECASLIGMRRPDVVYHLAAVPTGPSTSTKVASSFAVTMALVDAARQHRAPKIVVALPASRLFGRPASRELPVKEGPLVPRGVRGVVARATVDLLETARELDAVEFTALAVASVYGPRQRADGGVVAAFAAAARGGSAPVMTGDGRQTRDFVFIDDVVDALARAGVRGSGLVINVGTGVQTSIRDLWTAIRGRAPTEPQFAPAEPDEIARFAVSATRARIHLGWSAWTDLSEGLRQLR